MLLTLETGRDSVTYWRVAALSTDGEEVFLFLVFPHLSSEL